MSKCISCEIKNLALSEYSSTLSTIFTDTLAIVCVVRQTDDVNVVTRNYSSVLYELGQTRLNVTNTVYCNMSYDISNRQNNLLDFYICLSVLAIYYTVSQ